SNGKPFWNLKADDNTKGDRPTRTVWEIVNKNVPVPVDRWFKFEVFWSRGSYAKANGRAYVAIDNQVASDYRGQMMGRKELPMLVIMPFQNYGSMALPSSQLIDNLKIRSGL